LAEPLTIRASAR